MIILITGASGSGKTATLKALETKLLKEQVSINHFDDNGIPPFEVMIKEYGSGEKWQEAMLLKWINKLLKIKDKKFIFLEGSFYPEFATFHLKENYLLICIHAEREIREKRLILDRKQPELANQYMENYAQALKQKTIKLGGAVIDSSFKDANSTAEEIITIITSLK